MFAPDPTPYHTYHRRLFVVLLILEYGDLGTVHAQYFPENDVDRSCELVTDLALDALG
jgi:hypothetical protein